MTMKSDKKLVFIFQDPAADELAARAIGQVRNGRPPQLTGLERSVHFLRGVLSRASICLPAFYQFLGAVSSSEEANQSGDTPFKVSQSYGDFASLSVLTLSCRKIFDNSAKYELTGANFGKCSDATLSEHARYWAKHSKLPEEDAFAALCFLRRLFADCSKNDTQLLQAAGQFQRRIGLLKQHADRAAAHLSHQNYSIGIVDVVHFVAVCVVLGEIVRQFDAPYLGNNYFKSLDRASYQAAKRQFPSIREFQLFTSWNISNQAAFYWKYEHGQGLDILYNSVQHAVGGEPL